MLLEVKKKISVHVKGFTLIEIIVVMGLVAVLSTLSIGGYLQYKRSTILSLSADSIISQISSQRNKAILGVYRSQRADEIRKDLEKDGSGDLSETSDSRCFVISFEKDPSGDGFLAYTSQKTFNGKKKWVSNSWVYEGCENEKDGDGPEKIPLELDSIVKIDSVSVGNFSGDAEGNKASTSLEVRFLPPDGKAEIFKDGEKEKADSVGVSMKIDISYGDNNPDYKKSIYFDFVSGVSSVVDGAAQTSTK
ncbi:MAG: prepilin-type N-terminal cleavage/methylation domain-containing protein [Candidatus Peregrinibacteria bacterium]|nr:prepilin-type N-terminal cleavage/methylation domain-containing protein [Candidatus Peregrinibacteria bacterium]